MTMKIVLSVDPQVMSGEYWSIIRYGLFTMQNVKHWQLLGH